ncbi:MAG: rhodanese-like domain-containing protein [Phascolarctobacterium sp.]|uniref:rhodanese-like domain-containing protein n=1 Tax=Phascolarctobacterium sp. TaxID=2049039 RepID=UPI0025FBE46A|nr:rhodanese-like domain-containing protein [Phascolarctobacterium sp.]MCC8157805.1 rhodanese-like domain-containing protein [Phascolarctobacterium sp.]
MSKLSVFLLCILAAIGFWFYSKGACPLQALGRNSAAAAGENYQNITAAQVKARLDKGDMLTVIDVRTKEEYASGHVPGSILIPFDEIKAKAGQLPQDKNTEIVVYCRSGRRSAIAADTLIALGYNRIYDMGAVSSWTYGLEK